MDPRSIEARAAARQELTSWAAALQVLVDHQCDVSWRGRTCTCCGTPWPCPVREGALDELAGPLPPFKAQR